MNLHKHICGLVFHVAFYEAKQPLLWIINICNIVDNFQLDISTVKNTLYLCSVYMFCMTWRGSVRDHLSSDAFIY